MRYSRTAPDNYPEQNADAMVENVDFNLPDAQSSSKGSPAAPHPTPGHQCPNLLMTIIVMIIRRNISSLFRRALDTWDKGRGLRS
jgi:hypothetical protein